MKQLEIIEENGTTKIKNITEELTKKDALLMLLSAYVGICNVYNVDPVDLLVSAM